MYIVNVKRTFPFIITLLSYLISSRTRPWFLIVDSTFFYSSLDLFSFFTHFFLPLILLSFLFLRSLTACATQTSLNSNFNLYGSPADYSKAQACSVTASKTLYYAYNDCYCTDGGKYSHWQSLTLIITWRDHELF